MRKRLTMEEIAEELGVSRLTVSSVINNRYLERKISESTALRVREHLLARGYVPSSQALSLKKGSRKIAGILYCGSLHSHLTEAFNRLTADLYFNPGQYEIMFVSRPNILKGLEEIIARGVSHLIWIHRAWPGKEFIEEKRLIALLGNLKTIIYNYRFGSSDGWDEKLNEHGIHMVGVNRQNGLKKLARLLKKLKHRVVSLPEREEGDETGIEAQAEKVFIDHGLEVICNRPRNLRIEVTRAYGQALGKCVIAANQKHSATAACLFHDEIAGYTMSALLEKGIRIPEDVTVTGFGGIGISSAFAVPLTTLKVPVGPMVDKVKNLLEEECQEYEHCFPLGLIKAASHGLAACNSG